MPQQLLRSGSPAESLKEAATRPTKRLMWGHLVVVIFWSGLAVLGLTVYRWNAKKETEDEKHIKEGQDWAVHFVKQSMANSPGLLTAVTKNFINQPQDIYVDLDSCEWDGYPLWHGSPKNPNWFGGTKDITGYHVQCRVYVQRAEDNEILYGDEMQFTWDVAGGW